MLPLFLGLNGANTLILMLVVLFATMNDATPKFLSAITPHHALVGIFAAFLTALTHSVTFTYFMATTKWLEAAAIKANLNRDVYIVRTRADKTRVLMLAIAMIGITFAAIFSGAAADVAVTTFGTTSIIHLATGVAALLGNLAGGFLLFRHVRQRGRLMHSALTAIAAYDRNPLAAPSSSPGSVGTFLLGVMACPLVFGVSNISHASTSEPTPEPATSQPATSQPATDPEVEAWLTRIEFAHDAITSLRAAITYDRNQLKLGDRQRRYGSLVYSAGPPARFAIHFHHLKVNRRRLERNRWYIFDGRYFIERLDDQKQFFRRELAPPGTEGRRVSLTMGEGPFLVPLPLRKAPLLSRFVVTIVPPGESAMPNAVHLRLIPRNDRRMEVRRIDIWLDKQRLIPVKALTIDRSHYESIVKIDLASLQLNEPIADEVFRATAPAGPDWLVEEIPYAPPATNDPKASEGDPANPRTPSDGSTTR